MYPDAEAAPPRVTVRTTEPDKLGRRTQDACRPPGQAEETVLLCFVFSSIKYLNSSLNQNGCRSRELVLSASTSHPEPERHPRLRITLLRPAGGFCGKLRMSGVTSDHLLFSASSSRDQRSYGEPSTLIQLSFLFFPFHTVPNK